MSKEKDNDLLESITNSEYKYGFSSVLEADEAPMGLREDTIRFISARKNEPEWMLNWRLKAYQTWLGMKMPSWQNVTFPKINFQDIIYYSAPKAKG